MENSLMMRDKIEWKVKMQNHTLGLNQLFFRERDTERSIIMGGKKIKIKIKLKIRKSK